MTNMNMNKSDKIGRVIVVVSHCEQMRKKIESELK